MEGKTKFMLYAFLLRLIIILYIKHHDDNSEVLKFTDTDYEVFSDAATYVYNGESPFRRWTYRYTPLAAYICLVNNIFHPLAGKIVFCLFDAAIGYLLWEFIEHQRKHLPKELLEKVYSTKTYVAVWLYNPIMIGITCRGSNDNIISFFILAALYYLLHRKFVAAGLWFGLAVHFKIYPIIYSFVLYFWIDMDFKAIKEGRTLQAITSKKGFFTKDRLTFTFVSAGTFIGLTALFYVLYGYEFLYEAYLYHFVRKDHRHNNSIYFYMIYQLFEEPTMTAIAVLTFVPQWLCVIASGLIFYYDLWLCLAVQTWMFVIFNKVMTAQYYLWYLLILPVVFVNSQASLGKLKVLLINMILWALGQAGWGYYANAFENGGEATIAAIQNANYIWFLINMAAAY